MQKCRLCGEKFEDKADLFEHYENCHSDKLLNNQRMNGAQMHFFIGHGRITGKCRICGKPTKWNPATNLPCPLCGSKKCDAEYRNIFVKRMKKVYGKEHLLNDPEVQKKMLSHRSISGLYDWSDGTKKQFVGTYEFDFLKFLDKFYRFPSNDVITPAPQIIKYNYEGKAHFYIPDVFIPSLNLIIEIKDGGSNPNTHPKIMAVDKVKEKLKDEAVEKSGFNYLKLTDKKYGAFVDFLLAYNDDKYVDTKLTESVYSEPESLSEELINKLKNKMEYNYFIISDTPYFNGSLNKFGILTSNKENGKFELITLCKDDEGTEGNKVIISSILDGLCDNLVYVFAMKKNGKDIHDSIYSDDHFEINNMYKTLCSYYDEYDPKILDLYDYLNRSGNFKRCFNGKFLNFINSIDSIECKLLGSDTYNTLCEKYLNNKLLFNEQMNRAEQEAEPLLEMIMENNQGLDNKDNILKEMNKTMVNKKYRSLIENSYRISQIKIIENIIYEDIEVKEQDKIKLIKLAELQEGIIDSINKDEMDITILPVKIEETISPTMLKNLDKDNNNIFKEYKSIIQEGKFLTEGFLSGVNYLNKRKQLTEQIKNEIDENPKANNILKKQYLGIGDM